MKIIYAAMHKGNFKRNLKVVEKMNLGKIARELENLDNSDDMPEYTEEDYNTIDEIREIRNYWCHQCYLDFAICIDGEFVEAKPDTFNGDVGIKNLRFGDIVTDICACGEKCIVKSNEDYTLEINGTEYSIVKGINEFIVS